jgi:large subunit ribosomal protein L13
MPTIPKTTLEKTGQVDQKWLVVDADNYIVGRLASKIAVVLMGKHKPSYTPHVDTGDYVIVLNAERVRFSGGPAKHDSHPYPTTKLASKIYDRYTGYPGGRKTLTAIEVWERKPEQILREAVRRMLPKNKLGRHMLAKLKLYVGTDHPHAAQQPEPMPEYLLPKSK